MGRYRGGYSIGFEGDGVGIVPHVDTFDTLSTGVTVGMVVHLLKRHKEIDGGRGGGAGSRTLFAREGSMRLSLKDGRLVWEVNTTAGLAKAVGVTKLSVV